MANDMINSLNFGGNTHVFSIPYGTCSTAAGTAAKAVTVDNFSLETGAIVAVKFTVTNTAASPTLNINSTGAKNIYYNGAAITAGYLKANKVYEFIYNGTQWDFIGDIDTNSTYTSLKNPNALTVKGNGTQSFTYDGSTAKTLNIKAGTNVSVSSDTSGNITISSTDTNTTYSAGNGLTMSGTTLAVGAGTGISVAADTVGLATCGTAGTYGPTANVSGSNGATIKVPQITTDAYGRVTSITERTYTSVNTDTNTTYSAGTGLSLSGTTFSNSGVRSITTGSTNGTISVNTNGTSANVAVKGLGTAAYQNIEAFADKTEGVFFIEGSGTTDSTAKTSTWTGESDRITEYYDGLTIRYKIGVAGQSTVTLNINNLGAKNVYRFNTTKLTTQFPVGSIITLIYHADLNSGCWITNDYDANTNTQQRVYETSSNKEYAITTRYNQTDGETYYAEYGRYSNGVTLNPSTNTITATTFKGALSGNATTATTATTANKVANSLTIQGNGITAGTFNGSAAESVNIKGAGSTTVTGADGVITITGATIPTSLKNPNALTIQGNGTTLTNGTYDGSAAKTVNITPSVIGAAPTAHASTATTYGIGTSSNYGHVKLSDSTSSTSAASAGIAASPKAVKTVYDAAAKLASANTFSATNTFNGTTNLNGVVVIDATTYGSTTPSSASTGQLFFVEDDTSMPSGGTAGQILMSNGVEGQWTSIVDNSSNISSKKYMLNVTSGTIGYDNAIYTQNNVLYGAAWNDYAEYRRQIEKIEPGYCVASSDNGKVYKTTEKFQACDGIVSDTFGFAIGETKDSQTPLAVAGRVLAYYEGNREDYHAGDTVCAGPEGKVYKMTREEIREWPDRIIGIVSEIPTYEIWGQNNIKVNNRIWIKVK